MFEPLSSILNAFSYFVYAIHIKSYKYTLELFRILFLKSDNILKEFSDPNCTYIENEARSVRQQVHYYHQLTKTINLKSKLHKASVMEFSTCHF